jgi:hypothetical protein
MPPGIWVARCRILIPVTLAFLNFALRQRRMSTYLSTGNPTDYVNKGRPPVQRRAICSTHLIDKTRPSFNPGFLKKQWLAA